MKTVIEQYKHIDEGNRSFDIAFWQSQNDTAIFEAAWKMLQDYFLIRGENADKPRLQRTVESFRKSRSDLIRAKEASGRTQDKMDAQMLKEAEKLSW